MKYLLLLLMLTACATENKADWICMHSSTYPGVTGWGKTKEEATFNMRQYSCKLMENESCLTRQCDDLFQ